MMNDRDNTRTCSKCGRPIRMRLNPGEDLTMVDMDGRLHICRDRKPIGEAVQGHVIDGYHVRNRRLTIVLDGEMTLEVSSGSSHRIGERPPVHMRLITSDGVMEE